MARKIVRRIASLLVLGLLASSCATMRPAPPTPGEGFLLGPTEIIARSRHQTMKAGIEIEGEMEGRRQEGGGTMRLDPSSAVLYIEEPDRARFRVFSFGLPAADFLYSDGEVRSNPEVTPETIREAVPILFSAVFWWSRMANANLTAEPGYYRFVSDGQEILIDRATLLPLAQILDTPIERIEIEYAEPARFGKGLWYPSLITVRASSYRLKVTIRNLTFDTTLDPGIFAWPFP